MIDVLIISSLSERYYYESFVCACESLGVRVGILDPEYFITAKSVLHVHFHNGVMCGFVDLIKLGNDTNTVIRAPLEDIKVAWYLRVQRTRRVRDIEDVAERFGWSESLYALEALYTCLSCQWINTYETIERLTCNKLIQQLYAHSVGLKTPSTVLSNEPRRVVDFSREHGERALLKSIGYVELDPKGEFVLYSELFTQRELEEGQEAIGACPVYAQMYIPKRYEYRVMVIGERTLACRIDSQASEKTRIDWRHYDFEHVEHMAVALPRGVEEKLLMFMRRLHLSYGAIDLIETPSGEYVFLEVNPSGQWDWIAKLAGLPVASTVAQMLKSFC